jgi:hypothetical protein
MDLSGIFKSIMDLNIDIGLDNKYVDEPIFNDKFKT